MYFVEVDPTTGELPVSATVSLSFDDTDFGATTNSQRVAAVLGNSTAEAAFGTGARSAQTLRVTVATDDDVPVSINAGTNNIGDVDIASAIPAGTNNIGDVDVATIAAGTNNIGIVEAAGKSSVELIHNDHSSTAITTSAYVQLVASTSGDVNRWHIFDGSGEGLILATGSAASEVDIAYIPPGGLDSPLDLYVASGTRISVKALTGNTSSGDLIITALD